jgi:hypothetical protein
VDALDNISRNKLVRQVNESAIDTHSDDAAIGEERKTITRFRHGDGGGDFSHGLRLQLKRKQLFKPIARKSPAGAGPSSLSGGRYWDRTSASELWSTHRVDASGEVTGDLRWNE